MSNLYWPETIIFWGAGATAYLGIPTTQQQGEILRILADVDDNSSLDRRIERVEVFAEIKEDIKNLLIALGDNLESRLGEIKGEEYSAFVRMLKNNRIFKVREIKEDNVIDRIIMLRKNYDWDALKRIIRICPKENFLQNLFNIIDFHLSEGKGLYVLDKKGDKFFIQNFRLSGARNCLIALIQTMIASAYYKLIYREKDKLKPYIEFARALAELMIKEGIYKSEEKYSFDERNFYLFSYGIISMNFDPILLWLLFNAHKEVNDREILIGTPAVPIKLFHDLGNVVASYKIENEGTRDKFWYTFHESAAQRLNNSEYTLNRVVRIGKFYFPHGNCLLRECPNCGKTMMHFGEEWSFYSESLFPVSIIPALRKIKAQNKEEEDKIKYKYVFDALRCPYCGSLIESYNSLMIMQTSFKSNLPSFIEETQKEVRVCLENSKHIILLGYSFPSDDLVWDIVMHSKKSSMKKKESRCTVIVGYKGPKNWLKDKELESYIKKHENKSNSQDYGVPTIKKMIDIFGIRNVRAYTGGIPDIWANGNIFANTRKILYWDY